MSDERRGDWMQTYTGRKFWPLDPREEDIDPADIAHALSLICRFGGHVTRFYSVAEHCVLLSRAVDPEFALWALLHDAAEAYIGDMVRPLKRSMPWFREAEGRILAEIVGRFDLQPRWMPHAVIDADNRILHSERVALLRPTADHWPTDDLEPLPVQVTGWLPAVAAKAWRDRLEELMPSAVQR